MTPDWLSVRRADTPLILCMPHGGTDLAGLDDVFVSPWLARRDADWHIAALYDGLAEATVVSTAISRSVIDVNRDPSGASLYPGQATTELCPTTTFDGAPLYRGEGPGAAEVARRRAAFFDPYHAALAHEIARLRTRHERVVVYDCHSIRSVVPRLFGGLLPVYNIGTNAGTTCDPALSDAVATVCASSGRSYVVDGRFRGGWTTRHYGRPSEGVHAIQMEIAMRGYVRSDRSPTPDVWPPDYDATAATQSRATLANILSACLEFAR
ncbi:N-formylglutamate deformylase [Sphingomonas adhaesiva]|uniref:N-formylglutamate deformylase n=1 Tax=Sphingomonas adhaesiva TaxID=28212 RepID=UPI002FF7DAFC